MTCKWISCRKHPNLQILDVRSLVEVKFNYCRIIPHYYNNKFAPHCIHSLFLFSFSTHLTLPFIKTPNSWLFHITKIYTSKYIVKNSKKKITIQFIISWYYRKFTQWYKHKIHYKSLCFFVSLKTWIKITAESHVLLKYFKTTIKIQCNIKTKSKVFYCKFLQLLSLIPQNCVSKNYVFSFLDPPPLGNPQSSSWFKTNNNSKFKLTKFLDQSLSWMLIHPKSCIHPTPLTLPPLYFGFHPQNPWKMT